MRRTILSALALIPVLAQAQSSTSAGSQAARSSNTLVAAADTAPSGLAVPVRQTVREHATSGFTEAELNQGGTLSYTMSGTRLEVIEPKLIRTVPLNLLAAELATQPEVSTVAVSMTVDTLGIPRNLFIEKSAGAAVDAKAMAAVSQYRFAPATRDNIAIPGTATVSVSIRK